MRNGNTIHYTSDNLAYYPIEIFQQATLEMFGASIDYTEIKDIGPESGTICVASGYGPGYVEGYIIESSIVCHENFVTANAELNWNEPGELTPVNLDLMKYIFLWTPGNKYCQYQLQSITKQ